MDLTRGGGPGHDGAADAVGKDKFDVSAAGARAKSRREASELRKSVPPRANVRPKKRKVTFPYELKPASDISIGDFAALKAYFGVL
jgi:hypothetical protein